MSDDLSSKVALLEQREADHRTMLAAMDGKLSTILVSLSRIQLLENQHMNQNEAVVRAFKKIEDLETTTDALLAAKNKIEGMATMAWLLWTGMGASIVAMLVKVLFFMGPK